LALTLWGGLIPQCPNLFVTWALDPAGRGFTTRLDQQRGGRRSAADRSRFGWEMGENDAFFRTVKITHARDVDGSGRSYPRRNKRPKKLFMSAGDWLLAPERHNLEYADDWSRRLSDQSLSRPCDGNALCAAEHGKVDIGRDTKETNKNLRHCFADPDVQRPGPSLGHPGPN